MKIVGAVSVTDVEVWQRRISSARTRRERCESSWQSYARLHTLAYLAAKAKNDDPNVHLPDGDQVKIGLVHRNLEQTFAMLDTPEVSIKATAQDYTRPMDGTDIHREALVEYALRGSLYGGGLMGRGDAASAVDRDAVICGHGITYSWWRMIEADVPSAEAILQMVQAEDGSFVPAMDPTGAQMYGRALERRVIYQAVQDDHVSVLEFLFDASAFSIEAASWHGREVITTLDALRQQGFNVPADIKTSAIRRKSLYGEDPQTDEALEENSVRHIIIWDKQARELIHFVESCEFSAQAARSGRGKAVQSKLFEIKRDEWPVTFDHPDASPFNFFIPMPANDLPFGISQVEPIRVLGLEADKLRTRAANLTREQKLLILYRVGTITKEELEIAMKSPDGAAVGVKVPTDVAWDQVLKMIQSTATPREIYTQIAQAVDDVDRNTGVSAVAQGGAETATESDRIFSIGSARVNRKRNRKLQFIGRVADTHRCFLREFAPPGQTAVVPDEIGAPQQLTYGREAFQGKFEIQAISGEAGMTPVRQKFLSDMFGTLTGRFGPQFDLALLRQSLTMFDVKGAEALMRAARAGVAPMGIPGAPPMPQGGEAITSNGQAIRSAINAITESSPRR